MTISQRRTMQHAIQLKLGNLSMQPRDQNDGSRRQWRRIEDSRNASWASQMSALSRVVVKHEAWFQDMGVGDMSLEQRQALPGTLEATVETRRERERWRKRTIGLVGLVSAAGAFAGPLLEKLLGVIH